VITVRLRSPPLPMASVGRDIELTVKLDRPHGARTVIDGNGGEVLPHR
jgi:hypothetical protein